MAREMTDEEKMEYDRLTANMEQMRLRLDELTAGPVVYGYARVSTYGQAAHGNSLEEQKRQLIAVGAEEVFADVFTGKQMDRPELQKLIGRLGEGDTLIVTKLDRLGRSVAQASALITSLLDAGVTINVLNLGVLSNNSVSTLMRNILLCFAQYERDMIVERTQEGRAVARRKPGYREGRPRKYSRAQIEHALFLLDDHSYKQVADMTGISKATLARERRKHTIDV
jgi:DNA invertase Pin-like site-specific DNA recombinase